MKDPVFSGATLEDAVAAAAAALQVPASRVRYVVLPAGSGEATVRIAVLLDALASAHGGAPPRQGGGAPPAGLDARLPGLLRAIAGAAGTDVEVALAREGHRLSLEVSGPGVAFFLRDGAAVLRAAELLLQRAADRDSGELRVTVGAPGYREAREAWLAQQAREAAELVRREGRPRELEPLNSYERRLVHVALAGESGVRSFSVGSGGERRVTIAPAEGSGGEG